MVRRTTGILSKSTSSSSHRLTVHSEMASPEAGIQAERKTEAHSGLLTLYLMNRTLIHVPGVTNARSPAGLTEIERLDKEMVERWKGEADTVLVFVCARFYNALHAISF